MNPAPRTRMPVVFVGHGSPMNAIAESRWSRGFAQLGELVPRPRGIVSISAHWYVGGTYVTQERMPKTIHDFGGFPKELYEINYPAPGDPELAERLAGLLSRQGASTKTDWGLDHGTWTVLHWMYPEADIPTVQLSINGRLGPEQHLEIGRALRPLRDEGILILGSGNVVHNLRDAFTRMQTGSNDTPSWASDFDQQIAEVTIQRDTAKLVSALGSSAGRMAHPTPDHILPLLYVYGASSDEDDVQFPQVGFELGSLSMRNLLFT